MPENKKYVIQIPGQEHIAYWDAEKYESNKDKLYQKYPDAQVTEFSQADTTSINDNDMYAVAIPGQEHVASWDGKKLAANREKLMQKYPNAEISRVVDITAQRNNEFLQNYQTSLQRIKDESIPEAWRKLDENFVEQNKARFDKLRYDNFMASVKQQPMPEQKKPQEPIRNPLGGAWQTLKYDLGGITDAVGESLSKNNLGTWGDDQLWLDAHKEFERRIENGEPLFRRDQPLSSQTRATMSPDERNADTQKNKVNELINNLESAAKQDGKNAEETVREVLRSRAASPSAGFTAGQLLQDIGTRVMAANSRPVEGWGKVGTMIPIAVTTLGSIALAATGHVKEAKMLGDITMMSFAAATAGSAMKQARDAGATDNQVAAAGIASAAIMYGMGKIPFNRYINNVSSAAAARAISKEAGEGLEKELQLLISDAAKRGIAIKGAEKQFTTEFLKSWGKNIASSTASFAAMGGMEAIVPLIYEDPKRYPVLANVLESAKEGAIDGLMMGVIAGGFSTGAELYQHSKRWQERGSVYIGEVDLSEGQVYAVYDRDSKQWQPIDPKSRGAKGRMFAEILDVKEDPRNKNTRVYEIMLDDGSIGLVSPDVIKVARKVSFSKAKEDVAEAYKDNGYEKGAAAQTPNDINALRIEDSYARKKADAEAQANGTPSEGTQLDVQRADAAMQGRRDAVRNEILGRTGKPFWRQLTDDTPASESKSTVTKESDIVDVVKYKDGREVYLISVDRVGFITVDSEGNPGFISLQDLDAAIEKGEATLNTTSLEEYLDAKVREQDGLAEQERMANDQANNILALQQRVQQEGRINVGTPEAELWGTVVDVNPAVDGGIAVQVEGEARPRTLSWKDVASSYGMPFEPKTDRDIVNERLSADVAALKYNGTIKPGTELQVPIEGTDQVAVYKFGKAEVVDEGIVIIKATDAETGNEVDLIPDMISNLDEVQNDSSLLNEGSDVTVTEISQGNFDDPAANELGISRDYAYTTKKGRVVVDGGKLWAKNPQLWAQWNDRNPQRALSTKDYLKSKLSEIDKEVEKARTSLEMEAKGKQRPDTLEELQDKLTEKLERQKVVKDLFDSYVAAEEAEKEAKAAERRAEFQGKINEAKARKEQKEAEQQVMMTQNEAFRAHTEMAMAAPKAVGRSTKVYVGDNTLPAHYELVDAMVPLPSHDPLNGFQQNPGYPVDENGQSLNTRAYDKEKEEQEAALSIGEHLTGLMLQYMPVVSYEYKVVDGNKRSEGSILAAKNGTDTDYESDLLDRIEEFGFTKEQFEEMKAKGLHPRVVKRLDNPVPYTAKFMDAFNQSIGTAASTVATAAKVAKMTDEMLIMRIADIFRGAEDINAVYQSPNAINNLFNILEGEKIMPHTDRPKYIAKDGTLTGAGEDFVESLLFGTIFSTSDQAVRDAMADKSIRRAVAYAFPTLVRLRNLKADYTIMPEMTDAVSLLARAKVANEGKSEGALAQYMNQFTLFAEGLPVERATVQMLANVLNDKKYSSLRNVLDQYIERAEAANYGQAVFTDEGDILVESKERILRDVLAYNKINIEVYGNTAQQRVPANDEIRPADREQGSSGNGIDRAGEEHPASVQGEGNPPAPQVAAPLTPAQKTALEFTGTSPEKAVMDMAQRKLDDINKRLEDANYGNKRIALMREKAGVLQEMFEKLGARNTTVSTREDILGVFKRDGATLKNLNKLEAELDSVVPGKRFRGFYSGGKVYLIADDILDTDDGILANTHEEKHLENVQTGAPKKALETGVTQDELDQALVNLTGSLDYLGEKDVILADEILANAAEIARSEGVDAIPQKLRDAGITNEEFIKFVQKNIEDGQQRTGSEHLLFDGRDALQHNGAEVDSRQDVSNQAARPGTLEGQRGTDGRGVSPAGGGEGARVAEPTINPDTLHEVHKRIVANNGELREAGRNLPEEFHRALSDANRLRNANEPINGITKEEAFRALIREAEKHRGNAAADAVLAIVEKAGEGSGEAEVGSLFSFTGKKGKPVTQFSAEEKKRINSNIDKSIAFVDGISVKEAREQRLAREQKRKEETADLYSRVLNSQFDDVTLRLIDKYIDDVTPKNPYGKTLSQRLPQEVARGLYEGERTNKVDALFSRICEGAVPAARRNRPTERRRIARAKKEALRSWAIATGNWHTDLSQFTNDKEPFASGKDSDVYMSKDGKSVIKASKGKSSQKRFAPDIDNIPLFNYLFPNTAYKILGYGEINKKFVRILEQPFVDFDKADKLTADERVEYMDKLGFRPINKDKTVFTNRNMVVADLQKSNIVYDKARNIRIIDADVKLHTKDVGGDYSYPPVENDVPEGTVLFSVKDSEYLAAVKAGDMTKAQELVNRAAAAAGYTADSDYQGSLAFNGAAPSRNGYYETREERKNAFENGEFEDTYSLGDFVEAGIDNNDLEWQLANPIPASGKDQATLESIRNLNNAIKSGKGTIKMYRAVDSQVKEGSFRNGDWITPSREYAERHIGLQDWKKGRIIEKEVPIDDIWWNGDDINEWGYDDGKGYAYKNTQNNRKLLDPVTYDDNGNVIPLSERFNQDKEDIRFSKVGKSTKISNETPEGNLLLSVKDKFGGKSLVGIHNISGSKLAASIKTGGLANPSMAVIDLGFQVHEDYGDISLIAPSSMIDSETGRNAGTYNGDAWTPTYPGVSKQMSDKGWDKFFDEVRELPAPFDSQVRNDWREYLEDDRMGSSLHWWFLQETGKKPETIYNTSNLSEPDKTFIRSLSGKRIFGTDEDAAKAIELYRRLAEPEDVARAEQKVTLNENRSDRFRAYQEARNEDVDNWGIWTSPVVDFIEKLRQQVRYEGTIAEQATYRAAENYVRDNNLEEEFQKWLQNKEDQYEAKSVLFAGFTKDGDRKYVPNTVENASRLMNREPEQNAYGNNGLSATRSLLLRRMESLADIRKHRGELADIRGYASDTPEYEQAKDNWFDVIEALANMQRISDNEFSNIDYAEARLQQAILEKRPIAYLNREYGYKIPEKGEFADALKASIKEIKALPAKYFETKFNRPVYLNEFAAAVVPADTRSDVREALEKAGVPVYEYDSKTEGARQKAVLKASEADDIRFSISRFSPEVQKEMKTVREAAEERGTFMKAPNGKATNLSEENWMLVRTPNFKKYFGDWENAPEHASKVVDAEGEPLIVEHATNADFTEFDISHLGENSHDKGLFGAGFYFGTRAPGWMQGSKNLMRVYLNIRNPFEIFDGGSELGDIYNYIVRKFDNPTLRELTLTQYGKNIKLGEFIDIVKSVDDEIAQGLHNDDISKDEELQFYAPKDRIGVYRERLISSRAGDFGVLPRSMGYVIGEAIGSENFSDALKKAGYDGVIVDRGGDYKEYVAFEPNQIKSATDNNGNFSEGSNDIRFSVTDTPAFKKWFEGSKIVNEDGSPMVVYRGAKFDPLAQEPGMGVIKPQRYFSPDKKYADIYSRAGGATRAYYLSIKNPLDVRNKKDLELVRSLIPGREPHIGGTGALDWTELSAFDIDEFIEQHPEYDGIILDEGGHPDGKGGVYSRGLSFMPFFGGSQVKSAEQNNGEYSRDNDDVRFSVRRYRDFTQAQSEQKVSGKDYGEMDFDIRFSLSKNNRATVTTWLNKRTDLGPLSKAAIIDFIDDLDNPVLQLATAKWFSRGVIRLPEDMDKVEQAVSVSRKAKVDPLRYGSPMELLEAHAEFKPTEKKINPDEVQTLHRAAEHKEHGIVIYDVDDTEESRQNMRDIINSHFGKDASPWCLLQGDGNGNLTESSRQYWRNYNAYPKQVAFKDGKLLAFSANDSEKRVWWDREDSPHDAIPIKMKIPGDIYGRSAEYNVDPESGKVSAPHNIHKGNKTNGTWEEWDDSGEVLRVRYHYKNGRQEGVQEEFWEGGEPSLREEMHEGRNVGDYTTWYKNGQVKDEYHYGEYGLSGPQLQYNPDGSLSYRVTMVDGRKDGMEESWNAQGKLIGRGNYKLGKKDGLHETWNDRGDIKLSEVNFVNGERNGITRVWHWNGNLRTETTYKKDIPVGKRTSWYESGNIKSKMNYDEDGQLDGVVEYYHDYVGREQIAERTNMKHGVRHGLREGWYDKGLPEFRETYVDGVLDGVAEHWGENGVLRSRVTYKNGKLNGVSERWLSDGKLLFRAEMKDGEVVRKLYHDGESEESGPRFSDDDEKESLRFSLVNENHDIFISNARASIENIPMEKATPEQWLKMIESKGGLKTGEDKWIGLSDWLRASDKKTLTRQEVSRFIDENKIRIEETHYTDAENVPMGGDDEWDNLVAEHFGSEVLEAFEFYPGDGGTSISFRDEDKAADLYRRYQEQYSFEHQIETGDEDTPYSRLDMYWMRQFAERVAAYGDAQMRFRYGGTIHPTRLDYTSDGLTNKREIALTVPTIEPWNKNDDIHFGDAGKGRAIAWIRFGDTSVHLDMTREGMEAQEAKTAFLQRMYAKYGKYGTELLHSLTEEERAEFAPLLSASSRARRNAEKRVLVIDEIQSKRHQEGREKGYANPHLFNDAVIGTYLERTLAGVGRIESAPITSSTGDVIGRMNRTGDGWYYGELANGWETSAMPSEAAILNQLSILNNRGVLPAPFEKNWHELAMKRMLRLAAEEGYDYIAWTTGEQQAERYNIGDVVGSLYVDKRADEENRFVLIRPTNSYLDPIQLWFDEAGKVVTADRGEYENHTLAEVFGKELASKIMSSEDGTNISGDGLRVGASGMKGFYDEILPRFMNKYGKKWGVKVEDLQLLSVEGGATMHAVPVTDEMKDSVMDGQLMFSRVVKQPEIKPLEENDVLSQRAKKIRSLKAIPVKETNLDKKELCLAFTAQEPLEKDGKTIRFFGRTFDKNYRADGLFKHIAPVVREILDGAELAYTEKEKYAGTKRPDGTIHKEHRDVLTYDNYVGKIALGSEGKEYYVRITVANTGTKNTGVHSHFVSDVQLYEKTTKDASNPTIRRERLVSDGFVDTKLQFFFDLANIEGENNTLNDSQIASKEGDAVSFSHEGGLPTGTSRTSLVGRTYQKSKAFSFTGRDKIESAGDVAYIFKELETAATENSFIVFVKDGKPTILHTGIGTIDKTEIDSAPMVVGLKDFAPDIIYMVHNHPSGRVEASTADGKELDRLQMMAGDIPVQGIIIDTVSGEYGVFDKELGSTLIDSRTGNDAEAVPLEVLTFDKLVFSPDYQRNIGFVVKGPEDVAAYLSAHRLGQGEKLGALFLNKQQQVVGNLVFNENIMTSDNARGLAADAVEAAVRSAATSVILYGDMSTDKRTIWDFKTSIDRISGGNVRWLDAVKIDGNHTKSLSEGTLFDSAVDRYGEDRAEMIKTIDESGRAGLARVVGEDNLETLYRNIYKAIPQDILRPVVDKAMRNGLNIRKSVNDYLHGLAAAGTENDGTGLLFAVYDAVRSLTGNDNLTNNDIRYMIWKATKDYREGDLLSLAEDRAMQHRWKVGDYAEPSDLRFSASEDFSEATDEAREQYEKTVSDATDARKEAIKEARKSFKEELNPITKAMAAQKTFDRTTVDGIVKFAKTILKNGKVDALTLRESNRLLTLVAGANGKSATYATRYADQLLDVLLDHIVKTEAGRFQELVKVKDSAINQSGVETLGKLDVRGQLTMKAFRDHIKSTAEEIENRITEVSELMDDPSNAVREHAYAEHEGLLIARDYQIHLAENMKEEDDLLSELDYEKDAKKTGNIDKKTYDEYVRTTKEAIRENKMERVDLYREFSRRLANVISGSADKARKFREADKQRIEDIHHDANRDMQGVPTTEHRRDTRTERMLNSDALRFFLEPLATFDQMLRLFGNKNITGEGYLWNRYMRQWESSAENLYSGIFKATETLDDKVSKVFGKKMLWSDLYAVEHDMPKATITFMDGGEMREHELTAGNLLYIYMVNKMVDGKMKLRRMGISEEQVTDIKRSLDPRFIQLADWLQDEFLVNLRNKYNSVHERMFGAPMAAIEDYFPIKILANARVEEVDPGSKPEPGALSSTITGSIIKRRKNGLALDLLHTDAFSLVIEHIQQMEDWAAFAEFRRDMNTLLSYKRFRNQVQNMNTIYGSGEVLWNNFIDVATIAEGKYKSKVKRRGVDKFSLNVSKGVTMAKIALRVNTALKQLLSFPAYLPDVNVGDLAKSIATPASSWNWCMENLPVFQNRWKSRIAGDTRLMDTTSDWKIWHRKAVETAARWGMAPNAFVDALTVSVGTKAMYDTKYRQYIKGGYSEAEADKKAKQDATILYNQTQQSQEGAFVSTIQLDRTFLSVMLTTFRNSPMSYTRQLHDALRVYSRLADKTTRDERIDFMKKQRMKDGLNEDEAKNFAEKEYDRQKWRSAVRIAVFGFGLQLLWNLGSDIWYLLFGKDDKVKDKMLKDASTKALAGPIEGLSGGNVISDAWGTYSSGGKFRNFGLGELPVVSDTKKIIQELGYDKPAAINDIVNLVAQSGFGVNPQTLTDVVVSIIDACNGDLGMAKEVGILMMRIAQVPQSTIDEFYLDELDMSAANAKRLSPKQLAERYADYRMNRASGPFRGTYDEQTEARRHKAGEKRFKDKVKERNELNAQ